MSASPHALSVVQPVQITPAMLITTNVPEADHPVWAAGATYELGARVIWANRIYESLQANNVGRDPATSPTWWIDAGATNRWRVFDRIVNTQTTAPAGPTPTISYTIRPSRAVSALAVLNVAGCTSLQIRMVDPVHGTVYDKTTSFALQSVTQSWWAWFFGQKRRPEQHIALDLPAYPAADIIVTLVGNADLAVGVILLGPQQRYGLGVRHGARLGIQDYSRKETNQFGDAILVRRAFARRANFGMLIESGEVDSMQSFLARVRAVPCLWIGSNSIEATVVYGFYKNFEILISYPSHADCEIEIEGLT